VSSPVYSYAFYRNAGLVGDEPLAVPANYTAVVREILVNAAGDAFNDYHFRLKDGGTTATLVHLTTGSTASDVRLEWQGRIVFGTGAVIVVSSQTRPSDIYVGGYLIAGVAPIQIVGSPVP
jgi:hypothetical protein